MGLKEFFTLFLIFFSPKIAQSQIIFDTRGGDIHVPPVGSARFNATTGAELDLKFHKPVQHSLIQDVFDVLKNKIHFEKKSFDIPWNYIEDGCYIRAQITRYVLDEYQIDSFKVFAFGSLDFNNGSISANWSFHVANGIYSNQKVYIIDPAVHPNGPILIDEWIRLISNDQAVKISFCSPKTYQDYDSCSDPKEVSRERVLDELESLIFTANLRKK